MSQTMALPRGSSIPGCLDKHRKTLTVSSKWRAMGGGGDGARYHGQFTGRWKASVRLPKEGCDLRGPWRQAGL